MHLRASMWAVGFLLAYLVNSAHAEKRYGPGVTDLEIKIGQTIAYSGPASAWAILGRVETAYYAMINAQGGVNGRRINLISLDDAFSPPKTVEQIRKLIEQDEVLAIVGSLGTPTNLAVSKYLNSNHVPQILLGAGASKFSDPKDLPWTTAFLAPQRVEGGIYARYLLANKPEAKLGILYQNDDYGKGYLDALKAALGDKAPAMIVKELSYNITDPTIDSQIIQLKSSGADAFFLATSPKFTSMAIRKSYEIGWTPLKISLSGSSQITTVLRPAGLEASTGLVTSFFLKTPGDQLWENDGAMRDYYAFMKQWAPGEQPDDTTAVFAYSTAQMTVELLKNCGDDLTRENLMKQATNVRELQLPMFLPGIKIDISPNDYTPWHQAIMGRFDGKEWVLFGDLIGAIEN